MKEVTREDVIRYADKHNLHLDWYNSHGERPLDAYLDEYSYVDGIHDAVLTDLKSLKTIREMK